jgi:hypothetical protein
MNRAIEKIDFDHLARDIVIKSGTVDYPVPLASEIDSNYEGAYNSVKNPQYPTDLAYFHGPYILERDKMDLPQTIIDAQHQSFRDAIKLYMPYDQVAQHICTFMQKDFTFDPVFKKAALQNINALPKREPSTIFRNNRLDQKLSYQFDHPDHKTTRRHYFTSEEIETAHEVCKRYTSISMSVAAFQAGCIDYLQNLEYAFVRHPDFEKDVKARARTIITTLKTQWSTSNFASDIIPFIALAYHARDPSLESPVEEQDYQNGYSLGLRMGLFRNHIQSPLPEDHPQSGVRKFTCPARVAISSILARDWDETTNRNNNTNGRMLGLIHRHLVTIGLAPPPKSLEPESTSAPGHDSL